MIPSAYSWKDITVVLLGNIPIDIKEITYTKRKDKQNNYGKGTKPVSRSRGNEQFELQIRLAMSEVVAIRRALGGGQDETDLAPFDIPVTYTNDSGQVVTDTLNDVEFTEAAGGGNQNDLELVHTLPGLCSGIEFAE